MFELQKEHLAKLIPGNKDVDDWHEALVAVMPKYGINTKVQRITYEIQRNTTKIKDLLKTYKEIHVKPKKY